jgi:signal transduction histidine kinase/ActR/RegA family two-component response regulator
VRLLYSNASVGIAATGFAVVVLSWLQWGVIPHLTIVGWCLYMFLISAARFTLVRRYRHAAQAAQETPKRNRAFTVGAAAAGAGWAAAGLFLYPEAQLVNQVFLIFTLGGMMLGAATLLAPRPEAFVAFIAPAGFLPAARLLVQGDQDHLAMGILAVIFTVATLITTWRIYLAIANSLSLQFENQDLVEDLRAAKGRAETLNTELESRVAERTAELRLSAEQLRAEIAQRERIEEELLRARKLESLGVLAGGVAHDFHNFLAVVQGNVELAKIQLAAHEPVEATLDETALACQRAAFLASQLLTFAKGGAPVRRLISIGKLVIDAIHLARAGAQTAIEVSITDDLRFVEADTGQIGQVLHNILLNARQAMPEGGIIEVRAENVTLEDTGEPKPFVRISIRDYGSGIPADVLPRIFDPYFTTKAAGSGLGLATSYAIISKHGGRLTADSKLGLGTVFTIDLPASKATPAPQPPISADARAGRERLLVMDDEEALRKLLESVLTNLGYEVRTARDGAEAIALVEEANARGRGFDAALLDLTVTGGMGGIEAAARLKELDPALKLIVSSGYSDAPVMSSFRKYGFDDVIPKPWSVPELSEVFRRVLVPHPDRNAR